MSVSSSLTTTPARRRREIGRYGDASTGPTVVVTGGIHGNEPAGVTAIERLLDKLTSRGLPFGGELIGIVGNTRALATGRRYLTRDLNRHWTAAEIRASRGRDQELRGDEDCERHELLGAMRCALESASRPLLFIDLHSTSGSTVPFAAISDVLRSRRIARAAGIPVVMGLEEALEGSLLGYLTDLGHIGIAIEGGQHEDPDTPAHHEAAVWQVLAAAGCIDPGVVPDLEVLRERLSESTRGRARVIEIRRRHAISADDHFVMEPGFRNFDRVRKGQILARDRRGVIRAPEDAVMMLPLYQAMGEEGFFLAQQISGRWLRFGAALRRSGLDRRLEWLPGVRRDPEHLDRYLVSRRAAGSLRRGVLHTLGFRFERNAGDLVRFARRRPDALGLASLPDELAGLSVPS